MKRLTNLYNCNGFPKTGRRRCSAGFGDGVCCFIGGIRGDCGHVGMARAELQCGLYDFRGITAAIALVCIIIYPQFQSPTPQHKTMILRKRYWLYYALQFMAGARRQIFMVFAGFMMVERFGFAVHELTALYLINLALNMVLGPVFGKVVSYFGERNTLIFEYVGLALVFLAYGGIYMFGWGVMLAGALFVIDHLFFTGLCA